MNPIDITHRHLMECAEARAQHLEMYAAAFMKEVGSSTASKYILVERVSPDGLKRTWAFERPVDHCGEQGTMED